MAGSCRLPQAGLPLIWPLWPCGCSKHIFGAGHASAWPGAWGSAWAWLLPHTRTRVVAHTPPYMHAAHQQAAPQHGRSSPSCPASGQRQRVTQPAGACLVLSLHHAPPPPLHPYICTARQCSRRRVNGSTVRRTGRVATTPAVREDRLRDVAIQVPPVQHSTPALPESACSFAPGVTQVLCHRASARSGSQGGVACSRAHRRPNCVFTAATYPLQRPSTRV